jgi:hypothetical protein
MVKRKQPVQDVIHDLSDLLEITIDHLLYDGSERKRATLYVVKIRAKAKIKWSTKGIQS